MNRDEFYESLCSINRKAFLMFERYSEDTEIFIETGCHEGNTCEKAAIAGYKHIYSCDINQDFVKSSKQKMKKYANTCTADIRHQNSEDFFRDVLPTLDKKATFWLDAHGWGGGMPTYSELNLINELCSVRDNNILVDDIQLFFKHDISTLKNMILKINPNYKFEFVTLHGDGLDNVLMAYV